ncbi:MAG: deoxyhypusine synthase family protein [Candidatus Aenigmatarchaeota archaeon]
MNKKISIRDLLVKKVEAIEVEKDKRISKLLREMGNTGFQGKRLGIAVDIIEKMIRDKEVTIFLGYAGSLSTTGQWKIIKWFIERNFIDVLVPTGANISEDIVDAMGFGYWQGSEKIDDRILCKFSINRYYDVFVKESDYMKMTELIADFYMNELKEGYCYSSKEILYLFGKWLEKRGIESIVTAAARNRVPVFCPALIDSPYGDAILIAKSKGFNIVIDEAKDYVEFMRISEKIKESGVIYIGGGVPKDFIQLFAVTSNLLYPDRKVPGKNKGMKVLEKNKIIETHYPHKYAVQITTDTPQFGGLSGCTFEEAISWGKISATGNFVQVYCDATIALPLIAHALEERLENFERKRKVDLL